jgi:hypothetical protein
LDEDLEAAARLKALYPGNHPNWNLNKSKNKLKRMFF